ncbi:MAG: hypothetical protein P9L94_17925 [Candidatus Hinthialibacter antarcticus]|nr:hypothetical protein [Candidatus Hinthialibacter antarcticus]
MNERLVTYNNVRRILIRFIEQRLPEKYRNKADFIADQLMIDGEERRESSQSSITRAKMYLDWLVQQKKGPQIQEQCNLQRSFLDAKQSLLHEKIDAFLKTQLHLTKTVSDDSFDPSVHRAMIIDYIKQCLTVMILQKTIFQREIEISAELSTNVKEFMRTLLKQLQVKDPEKMMFVAQTMKVLNDGQINVNEIKKLNYQQMNHGLSQFQTRLESRQGELDHVAKSVKELQEFVKQNQQEFQPEPEEPKLQDNESSSSRRMTQAKRKE